MAIIIDITEDPFIAYKGQYLSLNDFLETDNLKQINFVRSMVAISGIEKIDTTKRKSLQSQSNLHITELPSALNEFIETNNLKIDEHGWKFLKYEEGDFFDKHVDINGLYTILLFPSNKINKNLIGGELIVDGQNINPNTFENSKLVIFPVNVYHEVKKVIKGTRYVFKISLLPNVESMSSLYEKTKKIPVSTQINQTKLRDPPLADVGFRYHARDNRVSDVGPDDYSDHFNIFGENSDY